MTSITRSTGEAVRPSALRRMSPVAKTLVAPGIYASWMALMWLFEGCIQTLLRP